MKLLFVGNTPWSMWNFRKDVMLFLKRKGHEVIVVAPEGDGREFLANNFAFKKLRFLSRKGRNPIFDALLFLELFFIYKKFSPDCVFHYTIKPNLYGTIAASFCRIPSFFMIAGMGHAFMKRGSLRFIATAMYRLAASKSKGVIFLNRADRLDFDQLGILNQNSRKSILMPGEGVDTKYFVPPPHPQFSGTNESAFIFVGRLLLDKGIREYLQAAKQVRALHPQIKFRVLGPIDKGNPSAISEKELNIYINDKVIEYLGSVRDVRPYLLEADALVLPTYYGEGLSRACLEAFALGRPVITTDNRGCIDLVKDGSTGSVVKQRSVESLTQALLRFIQLSEKQKKELGENGRRLVERHFNIEKVQSKYLELLESLSTLQTANKVTL